MSNRGWL